MLDRSLFQSGIYPPIGVLPSLSRLMKDGIGKQYTREDHAPLQSQLFAAYAKVQDVRSLASVIGEDELSDTDKSFLEFGKLFEQRFVGQGDTTNRSIDETLDLGWDLLSLLPKDQLDRLSPEMIEAYYDPKRAQEDLKLNRATHTIDEEF